MSEWFAEKGALMSDEVEDGSEVGQDLDDPTTPDDSSEEIAARTTDTDEESTRMYRKEFLVGAPWDEDYDYTDDDHEANAAALVQDAINAGLRIVGDVVFVGAEDSGTPYGRRGQTCVTLVYEAEAVPAHLIGAGPTAETSDVEGTMADSISPRDIIEGGQNEDGSVTPALLDDQGAPVEEGDQITEDEANSAKEIEPDSVRPTNPKHSTFDEDEEI